MNTCLYSYDKGNCVFAKIIYILKKNGSQWTYKVDTILIIILRYYSQFSLSLLRMCKESSKDYMVCDITVDWIPKQRSRITTIRPDIIATYKTIYNANLLTIWFLLWKIYFQKHHIYILTYNKIFSELINRS